MLFNTLDFALFFAVVLALYFLLPEGWRRALLLAASLFFYGYWDWRFLGLMAASILAAYVAGRVIESSVAARRRRAALWVGIAFNLLLLGVFKYFNFFADSLAALLRSLGMQEAAPPALRIALPVGISFFTFQAVGYVADVYRGKIRAEISPLDTALFIAFFPQLVAGPIERASRLLPQLKAHPTAHREQVASGAYWICWGLFKKVFIADNLALFVEPIFDRPGSAPGGLLVLFGLYAFAFQIYCDFSGYTDIAAGSARCLGIELSRNFDLPYLATSPRDFWRRWHITLSEWLRDYLYIPLGGSRGSAWATARNLFLTMLLGGLWHGAAWTFVLWGTFHGLLLLLHRGLASFLPAPETRASLRRLWWSVRVVTMFHLVCFGWLIFRAPDLRQAVSLLGQVLFHFDFSADVVPLALRLLFYVWPLALVQTAQAITGRTEVLSALPWPARGILYALGFLLFILFGAFESREFIYFQF
ncbi:MAG: MBOAT family protein [Planctomycetes bacterium]|nr:MBOAT family protein [Planctomycetota bacterium]